MFLYVTRHYLIKLLIRGEGIHPLFKDLTMKTSLFEHCGELITEFSY